MAGKPVSEQPWFIDLMRTMSGIPRPKTWPSQPAGSPALRQHAMFMRWHAWRAMAHKSPRPTDVWRKVPLWAWQLERDLLTKPRPHVPVDAPPYVPPPVPRVTLPLAFTAWGFRSGELNAGKVVPKAQACGAKAVAIQYEEIIDGAPISRVDTDALRDAGIEAFLWDGHTRGYDPDRIGETCRTLGIPEQNYIPQDESEHERAICLQAKADGFPITAIVGTLGGYAPSPIADADYLVEAYAPIPGPYGDTDRMCWQALHDGWRTASPVLGLWGGVPVEAHQGVQNHRGRWGVWLLETMTAADAAALKELT